MAVEKVVIIGSGQAGWTAAIYTARANLKPIVYEGHIPLGQLNLTTEVENFPTWPYADSEVLAQFSRSALPADRYDYISHLYEGKYAHRGRRSATGPELMQWSRQQAVNFGTRTVADEIEKVDFQKRPFTLYPSNGQPVQALTVIVATGASANYLGLPSEEHFKNKGVSACATCDGPLWRFRDKPLVVVGGGDTAAEEATHLSKFASTIYLVHRRKDLRASRIMQERVFNNEKIVPLMNSELVEVLGNNNDGVTGVRLRDSVEVRQRDGTFLPFREWLREHDLSEDAVRNLPATGVFLAIGHTPNTAFLGGQLLLDKVGYIQWTKPARTWTSVEGVFAAGDCADSYYRQAVTAAGTGCMAALDAERWLAEHGEL